MEVRHSQLGNGLQVVTARIPGFQSATITAAVNAGARYESAANNGIAHFLEHMAFKGTRSRSAPEIGAEVEQLGSSMDAFTSPSMTAYHISGLGAAADTWLAILADVLTESLLAPEDIDRERGVILQEIKRSDDNPQWVAGRCFARAAYPGQAAGQPVLGNPDFIRAASRNDFTAFLDTHYRTRSMAIVGAGDLDHLRVCDQAAECFARLPVGAGPPPEPARWVGGYAMEPTSRFEQVNVYLGMPSVPSIDPTFFTHRVMCIALGNGWSSPLFQEVRQKRALAYSTYALSDHHPDHGDVAVFGGMTPENIDTFLDVVCDLLCRADEVITEREVTRARNAMLVWLATEKERPYSLTMRLARQLFETGKPIDAAAERRRVEAITLDDVQEAARSLRGHRPTLAMAGPFDTDRDYYGRVRRALT